MALSFSDEKLNSKQLEISDLNLKKRLRRITPIIQTKGKFFTFDIGKLRHESFMWDPQNLQEIDITQYKTLMSTCPQFRCKRHDRFNPTLAEVMAQLPGDDEIAAFHIDDDAPVTVLANGEGHSVNCYWLGKA